MSSPTMVPMIAPDGSAGFVPEERVNEALSNGGQLGVKMQAPTGEIGIVPRANVVSAIRNGGKVLQDSAAPTSQIEQQNPDRDSLAEYLDAKPTEGIMSRGLKGIGRAVYGTLSMPYDTVSQFVDSPRDAQEQKIMKAGNVLPGGGTLALGLKRTVVDPLSNLAQESRQEFARGERARGFSKAVASGVPILGPMVDQLSERAGSGDVAGAGTEALTYAVLPKVAERTVNARGPFRGGMADRMRTVAPGEAFSPQEILDAARQKGINLDLADATGNGAARGVKAYAERSLGGRGTMRANTETNLQKLGNWADETLGQYAPQSTPREVLGGEMQGALQEDLAMKKTAAQTAFDDLDKRVGSNPIDASKTVQDAAQKILYDNKEYFQKHPELAPKQALKIVEDIADPAKGQYSWSELHQLRSDLLEFTRNNPDLVKNRATGWIQKLTGDIDAAMTDEATSKLSSRDLEQFRNANDLWTGIKESYDNPQSPLYHAIRSQYPSQVPGMLTKATPELASQVRTLMGDLEGPVQRHVVETLLTDKAGNIDLKNLNSRLSRVPNDYLESMLGKQGARDLRLLGKVSQRVTANLNPSGTSDVMVPAGEIGGAAGMMLTNPAVGAATLAGDVATGYGAARGLTSPAVTDYLTRKPIRGTRAIGRVPNTLGALAGLSSGRKRK